MRGMPHNKELRKRRILEVIAKEQPIGFNALLAKRIVSRRLIAKYLDELQHERLTRKQEDGRYVLTLVGSTRMSVPELYDFDLRLENVSHKFDPLPNHGSAVAGIMSSYPTPVPVDVIRSLSEEEKADLEYWTNFMQHEDFLPAKTAYEESVKGFAYFAQEYFNNVFHQRIITLARQSDASYKPFSLENLLNEPTVLVLSYKPPLNDKNREELKHAVAGFYLLSLLNIHTGYDDVVIKQMTKAQILDKEEGKILPYWIGYRKERVKKHIISKEIDSSIRDKHENEIYRLALRHLSLANLIDNKLKLFLVLPELLCLCRRNSKPRFPCTLDLPEVMSAISGIKDRDVMNEDWTQARADAMPYDDIIRKCKEKYAMRSQIADKQLKILEHWGIIRKEGTTDTKFKLDMVSDYPLEAAHGMWFVYIEDLSKAFGKRKRLSLREAQKIVENWPSKATIVKA